MSSSFSSSKYGAAVTDYQQNWALLDVTLYDLCRKHPEHSDPLAVHAKLWLIGRGYATGIERKVPSTGAQGSSLSQVAELFVRRAKSMDGWIGQLVAAPEPLTVPKVETIVGVHGKFVRLLGTLTRSGESTRSFVSKYLHFHCPTVPIYDSVTCRAMPSLVPWSDALQVFPVPEDGDKEYAWFVMRFWKLYQLAREAGVNVSVRHLDYYVLSVAEA